MYYKHGTIIIDGYETVSGPAVSNRIHSIQYCCLCVQAH